jgi:hypothetical protein
MQVRATWRPGLITSHCWGSATADRIDERSEAYSRAEPHIQEPLQYLQNKRGLAVWSAAPRNGPTSAARPIHAPSRIFRSLYNICKYMRIGGLERSDTKKNGSSGRTRTYNPPVNSRMLCH